MDGTASFQQYWEEPGHLEARNRGSISGDKFVFLLDEQMLKGALRELVN